MPRDRDWLDYTSLASQLGQNVQLNQLRRGLAGVGAHLDDIARAERDREWREQDREIRELERGWQEEEARDRRRRLREQIFEGAQRLKKLRAQATQADPHRALVVALVSVRPPPTADLDDYQDKERAQALREDVEAFARECEGRLGEAEQREVETCVEYLCGQGLLTLLIGHAEERRRLAEGRAKREAELKEKTAQLQALTAATPSAARDEQIRALAGLGSFVGCSASIALGIHFSTADNPIPLMVCIPVALAAFVPYYAVKEAQNAPARARARREIKDLENEIARGLGPPPPPNAELEHAAKRFGEGLDAAAYRKLFEERAAFVRGVLGVTKEVPPDLAGIDVGGINFAATLTLDEAKVQEAGRLAVAVDEDPDSGDLGATEGEMGDDEELFKQALEVLRVTRRASTSTLQRQMRIGYNRAARIMELMEERGIVGPENGAQPREILVDLDKL